MTRFRGRPCLEAAHNLQKSAPGLDRWPIEALKFMDIDSATALAILFDGIERVAVWPQALSTVRVAFLPKDTEGGRTVANWRPISLTAAVYRLYGRVRLGAVMCALAPHLHPGVIGGRPGDLATGQVFRMAAYAEAHMRGTGPPLQGVSLDASKCFDRIDWCQVAELARQQQVPGGIIRAFLGFYTQHRRFASLHGQISQDAWSLSRGLLQGCGLSIAFTLSLVSRWHYALDPTVHSLSFVDDRVIVVEEVGQLEAAWQASLGLGHGTGVAH